MKQSQTFKFPVKIIQPGHKKNIRKNNGLLLSIPHSGREYPNELLKTQNLNKIQWRYFEDPFVDILFLQAALKCQIPLIKARFPRAWADPNRPKNILNPKIQKQNKQYQKWIKNGLGVIPTKIPKYGEIYKKPITLKNAQQRIKNTWQPYHNTLEQYAEKIRKQKQICLLIDCHSMPANISADIILGTCHNQSCMPDITQMIEKICRKNGFSTLQNYPFAGGYITQKFGRGKINGTEQHYQWAIQIEINRSLYMDEKKFQKNQKFNQTRQKLTKVISEINQNIAKYKNKVPIAAE